MWSYVVLSVLAVLALLAVLVVAQKRREKFVGKMLLRAPDHFFVNFEDNKHVPGVYKIRAAFPTLAKRKLRMVDIRA
jgi:hypothetical protein